MDQGFGHVAGKDYSTQNRNSDSEETREGGSRKAKSSKALKPQKQVITRGCYQKGTFCKQESAHKVKAKFLKLESWTILKSPPKVEKEMNNSKEEKSDGQLKSSKIRNNLQKERKTHLYLSR